MSAAKPEHVYGNGIPAEIAAGTCVCLFYLRAEKSGPIPSGPHRPADDCGPLPPCEMGRRLGGEEAPRGVAKRIVFLVVDRAVAEHPGISPCTMHVQLRKLRGKKFDFVRHRIVWWRTAFS
jgi:hypothetical protein